MNWARLLLAPALAASIGAGGSVSAPRHGRVVSLAALERSLAGHRACTVVFDIDDTSLYSTIAFVYAQGYLEETDHGAYRTDPRFWTLINDSLDQRFSRPKEIARALIAFHQQRGDTIAFVTARFPSAPATDRTSRLLMRLFGLATPPTVIFTSQLPKTAAIRELHPALSYGDADGDIADTHAADPRIRAIRILRTPHSSNDRMPDPGKFDEEILAGSAD
ncbi:MAG: HAD family acid phosphatase [Gemmatimonadota bacterium]